MLVILVLLMSGRTLRVTSEILAYQDYAKWAWNILPVSALIELTAVTLFAVNLIARFAGPPVVVTSPTNHDNRIAIVERGGSEESRTTRARLTVSSFAFSVICSRSFWAATSEAEEPSLCEWRCGPSYRS